MQSDSVINEQVQARVFKLFKEKVNTDVYLSRVVAARFSNLKVIDNLVAEDLIFQLRTFLTAGDPKTHSEKTTMYFGYTPVYTCWNIFKLAVSLLPGLPKSWKYKIDKDIEFDEISGEYTTTHITRHLCPHYGFNGDEKHIEFLMGLDDLEKDV